LAWRRQNRALRPQTGDRGACKYYSTETEPGSSASIFQAPPKWNARFSFPLQAF
jgi:hypothetical protein